MPYYPPSSGGSSNSAGLAGTGAFYLLQTSGNGTLPFSKLIAAGSSVTTHTDNTTFYINAITSLFAGSAGLAGTGANYITYLADSTLSNEKVLTAGSSVTIRTDSTAIYINAITNAASSVVYAPTGGNYVSFEADANLTNEKILTAGSSVTIHTDSNAIYINATTSGGSSSSSPVAPGYVPLEGLSYINIQANTLGSGFTDLYTVPLGKNACWMGRQVFNTGSGSITEFLAIKSNSTYYRIGVNNSRASFTLGSDVETGFGVMGGETLAFNASSQGMNIIGRVIEFDSSSNLKFARIMSMSAGFNTVYTVPDGKSAFPLTRTSLANNNAISFRYMNNTSDTRTISWYLVKSGATVGNEFRMTQDFLPSSLAEGLVSFSPTLSSGDKVIISTDSASNTQIAYVNIMEV